MSYLSEIANIVAMLATTAVTGAGIYYKYIHKNMDAGDGKFLLYGGPVEVDYELDHLAREVQRIIITILNEQPEFEGLNKVETEKRLQAKARLRKAKEKAPTGDKAAKNYMKDIIPYILENYLKVNERTIDKTIYFEIEEKLSSQDKFEILMYLYMKKYRLDAFKKMVEEYHLAELTEDEKYEITAENINQIYREKMAGVKLSYNDKLAILTQRIYQMRFGFTVVDMLLDMHINGVHGGVSGIPAEMIDFEEEKELLKTATFSYDTVWVYMNTKKILLSFLSFGSMAELIRVVKNIYRYDNPEQLTRNNPIVGSERKDGSRVTVGRPPAADSWFFIVRQHSTATVLNRTFEEMYPNPGNELVKGVLNYSIQGCQNLAFTGPMGCGKTTLFKCCFQFVPKTYSVRVLELIFELALRKLYPDMNILTFREINSLNGQAILDFIMKTDGDIVMIGEVATAYVANWVVDMSQRAAKYVWLTNHANTTSDLVAWFRNARLLHGGLRNERIAEQEVVRSLNIDIHMENYIIKRITEIEPLEVKSDIDAIFQERDIIRFNEVTKEYEVINGFSEYRVEDILSHVPVQERENFISFQELLLQKSEERRLKQGR